MKKLYFTKNTLPMCLDLQEPTRIVLDLEELSSAGYIWSFKATPPNTALDLTEERLAPLGSSRDKPGDALLYRASFHAEHPGTISIIYKRPWERKIEARISFTISTTFKPQEDNMSTAYNGFFVRSYSGDTNSYPKPSGSAVWASPDIIPWGANVCQNPEETFLGANFNKDYGNEIIPGVVNYFYARGKNFDQAEVKCKLYLYWSNSTMLLAPNSWKNHAMNCTKGGNYISLTVGAGQEAVCSNEASGIFSWKPDQLNKNEHYCLISRVVSDKYPAPIPDLTNIDDFCVFIRSEKGMGYAQRNLRFKDVDIPDDVITETVENSFAEDITDAYMIVNCYNLPVGSTIQMTCPNSTKDCYLEVPESPITKLSTPTQPVSFAAHINKMPQGFKAPINVYFRSKGKPVPQNYDIGLDFIWVPGEAAKSIYLAQPLNLAGFQHLTQGPNQFLQGNAMAKAIGPRKSIRVGSCKTCYR